MYELNEKTAKYIVEEIKNLPTSEVEKVIKERMERGQAFLEKLRQARIITRETLDTIVTI